jgi:hypothetical protein
MREDEELEWRENIHLSTTVKRGGEHYPYPIAKKKLKQGWMHCCCCCHIRSLRRRGKGWTTTTTRW